MKKKQIIIIVITFILIAIFGILFSRYNFNPQEDGVDIYESFYTRLNEDNQKVEISVYEGNTETYIQYTNGSDSYKMDILYDEDNYFHLETDDEGMYTNLEYIVNGEDESDTFTTLYEDGTAPDYVYSNIYSIKSLADIDYMYDSIENLNVDSFQKDGQYISIENENDDQIKYQIKSNSREFIKSDGEDYKIIFEIK